MRKLVAFAALATLAIAGLVLGQRTETPAENAARCAEIAELGHVQGIGVPAGRTPDGYRDGVLTTRGCSYIAAPEARP